MARFIYDDNYLVCAVEVDGVAYTPDGVASLVGAAARLDQAIAERDLARADGAQLHTLVQTYMNCPICHGDGVHWSDVNGEAEAEPCDAWPALDAALRSFVGAGAPLLALRDAVRAYKREWDECTSSADPELRNTARDAVFAALEEAER